MTEQLKYQLQAMIEKGYAYASVFLSVLLELIAKYVFNDPDYFRFLFVLMCLDTIFGIAKTVKQSGLRALSFSAANGFVIKIALNLGAVILCHVASNFPINGIPNGLFDWFTKVVYCYLICKEILSVARNMNAISPAIVPTFLIDRLNSYVKSGKISDLKNDPQPNDKNNENPPSA